MFAAQLGPIVPFFAFNIMTGIFPAFFFLLAIGNLRVNEQSNAKLST